MRIDMPSKLLLDLKNGYNIGKLVRLDYDQKKKDGYLVAIPCQEYTINGETYTAIGTVYDHSKLDSMLKLKGYDGKAYLFMLDDDGNITYTNQSGDKYLRNYSLLKHLKGQQAITEEEADLFKKKFDNRESGVALFGKTEPLLYGVLPDRKQQHHFGMHCGKGSCGQCADGLPENGVVYNNTHGRFYTFTFCWIILQYFQT